MRLFAFLAPAAMAAGVILSTAPVSSQDEEALVVFQVMSLKTATALAEATLESCRKESYQVAVAVVDRFGLLQVTLRDRFAGPHTPETARRKAWTAVSFRSSTLDLSEATGPGQPNAGIRFVSDALMLGGGLPVLAAGTIVGGVGVSGAPSGEFDEACAQDGIDSIDDLLNF